MATTDRNGMIEEPAFLVLTLGNDTSIRGRFVAYSDPSDFQSYGTFKAVDSEGVTTYVLWAAIAHLVAWPAGVSPPPGSTVV